MQSSSSGNTASNIQDLSFWRRVSLALLPWMVLAAIYIPGTLYLDRAARVPNGWQYVVLHYVFIFTLWAAFTILIRRLLARFPLVWPPSTSALFAHIAFALFLITLHAICVGAFNQVVPPAIPVESYSKDVIDEILWRGPQGLVIYIATAACLSAWDALSRAHQREQLLIQAQLSALQAQIEPHFLFNTLNAISELVYRDAAMADRTLLHLSRLLRNLFERQEYEHLLSEELDLLREYLSIQHILLGDRLHMHWDVDEAALNFMVPTLLLQPLLENAIQHGISQLRKGGKVELSIAVKKEHLEIAMTNDGPLINLSVDASGIGMRNTRERLHTLYGEDQLLNLEILPAGGARVRLQLPLRERALA